MLWKGLCEECKSSVTALFFRKKTVVYRWRAQKRTGKRILIALKWKERTNRKGILQIWKILKQKHLRKKRWTPRAGLLNAIGRIRDIPCGHWCICIRGIIINLSWQWSASSQSMPESGCCPSSQRILLTMWRRTIRILSGILYFTVFWKRDWSC